MSPDVWHQEVWNTWIFIFGLRRQEFKGRSLIIFRIPFRHLRPVLFMVWSNMTAVFCLELMRASLSLSCGFPPSFRPSLFGKAKNVLSACIPGSPFLNLKVYCKSVFYEDISRIDFITDSRRFPKSFFF